MDTVLPLWPTFAAVALLGLVFVLGGILLGALVDRMRNSAHWNPVGEDVNHTANDGASSKFEPVAQERKSPYRPRDKPED